MNPSKKIVLGVSGGIAAYKACELLRLFQKQDYDVQVMMSKNAKEFVGELTFQALSGHAVFSNLFDLQQEGQIGHIKIADECDAVVLAPASANIIAKLAVGLADDVLSTVTLATKAPVFVAPAMNVNMWEHKATQNNIKSIQSYGYNIISPESGDLACGWTGEGRLASPETIFEQVITQLSKKSS
ncbi:MAG: bifunctional phosphopantothenoylcysteine decarboxylase/phosphopantothenate--cysteine ligase CoaBC [Deltaproteobacteria bacterium]|nr:bifunctional phosphopantothenoylcysteine decarboxylase/phosphopantothenate--cysteine ligase CoaBC [Deltaproteobacteria bacterium]